MVALVAVVVVSVVVIFIANINIIVRLNASRHRRISMVSIRSINLVHHITIS